MRVFLKSFLLIALLFGIMHIGSCSLVAPTVQCSYSSPDKAILDLADGRIGRYCDNSSNPVLIIQKQNQGAVITVLQDITISASLLLNNAELDLNGCSITLLDTASIIAYSNCKIYNGSITKSQNNLAPAALIGSRTAHLDIQDVSISAISSRDLNIGIQVEGQAYIRDTQIYVKSVNPTESFDTIGIANGLFSTLLMKNCDITSEADWGQVIGIHNKNTCELQSCNIQAYSNYKSNESGFTSASVGLLSDISACVENCFIYGTHSGINASGSLSITGGKYAGYGHGGIYCTGYNSKASIYGAEIVQDNMHSNYADYIGSNNSGLYIGGTHKSSNIEVFLDTCNIRAEKNAIVLRGTSGEYNNSLHVNNTLIQPLHIRVDNDSHKISISEGCNFDASSADIPEIVFYI